MDLLPQFKPRSKKTCNSSLGLPMKFTKTINGTGCDYIPMPTPSPTSECYAGTERLEVTLVTDNYASDTSWELVNTGTNQIEITQTSFVSNTLYVNNWCKPVAMYEFTIYDSYGDGICCGYGAGSYTVKWGGETVGSGGAFSSSATHAFGSTPTNPPTLPSCTDECHCSLFSLVTCHLIAHHWWTRSRRSNSAGKQSGGGGGGHGQ